jgi:hypothetical protein
MQRASKLEEESREDKESKTPLQERWRRDNMGCLFACICTSMWIFAVRNDGAQATK